ncbi:hypothetical protein H5410_021979 [Solanum commersonii]|uniref:Uncharacterized protein n=1 Tax=Solanum commersonii TaxID=4109 RepID=A0A9J5ZDH7_SOLCO|nr:hypothetical protein H5410_021979 [Solanum commersonii]
MVPFSDDDVDRKREICMELKNKTNEALRKEVSVVGGIPQVKWTEEEVERMNLIEDLQFAVIGKFTYEWSDLEELRKIIPQQREIRGGSSAVGKPIQLDQATTNKMRPSCARVKVMLDLKGDFSKAVEMQIENQVTGEIRTNMITINYDYIPQYCIQCKMQEVAQEKIGPVHTFQKGKAKVLSSRKVVGDPGHWNVVRDNRKNRSINEKHDNQMTVTTENSFDALTQEEITRADFNIGSNSNINTKQDKGSFGQVLQGQASTSTMPMQHDNMDQNQQHNTHENEHGNENHESVNMEDKQQTCRDSWAVRREYRGNIDNKLAIIFDPTDCQIEEGQILAIRESPNKVLHDIITHNVEENALLEIEGLGVTTKVNKDDDDDVLAHRDKEADLSPTILKEARREKKQGNGDSAKPIRIQPKGYKAYNR